MNYPIRKIAFRTVGCRTNQEEIAIMQLECKAKGFLIVENPSDADIVVINSCAVTSHSESTTVRLVGSIANDSPHAKILITGCLAQHVPERLKNLKNVAWVVGNTFKDQLISIIENDSPAIYHSKFTKSTTPLTHEIPEQVFQNFRTRFPLKIQEGCDCACAYCIVPSLRGPSRSVPSEILISTCKKAIDHGYKEIIIAGTHIGQYNDSKCTIFGLLEKIISLPGDFRVRLSSFDFREITPNLLNLIESESRLCKHLHISMQSLDKNVLTRMNREMSDFEYRYDILLRFREKNDWFGLGADILVGFPGETDQEFENNLLHIEKLNLSYVHTFRFSPRPGTKAFELGDPILSSTKVSRSEQVRNLVAQSREKFLSRQTMITHDIIVEHEYPIRGVSSNYIHMEIPDVKGTWGQWAKVRYTGVKRGKFCQGTIAEAITT